jgi:hypothetical protein
MQGTAAAPAAARGEGRDHFPDLRRELGGQDRAIKAAPRDLAVTQPPKLDDTGLELGVLVERVIESGTRQLSFDLTPEPNSVLSANRGAQMVLTPVGLARHARQASLGTYWRPVMN